MKKILTVSLVAMMAVTAANADIASTKYVDDRTGDISTLTTTNTSSLTAAVNELNTTVTSLNTGASAGVATQITNALKGATADNFSDDVKASLGKADTAVQQADVTTGATNGTIKVKGTEVSVAGLGSAAYTSSTAYDASGSAAAAQEAAEKTAREALAAAKSELEGKITQAGTNTTQLATRVETIENSAAYTSGINADKVGQIATNASDIATIKSGQSTQDNKISALETSLTAEGTTGKQIAAAQAAADKAQGDIDAYIASNDKALADYKTEAANTFMDSGEVGAAITAAVNSETGALKDYSTTEEMNTAIENANDAQTTTITNAYKAADTALETALKKYADDQDSAQTTELKAYADQAETDAVSTAKTFTTEEIAKIINASDMTDGTKVLTLKVNGNEKTLGWETIGR